MNKDSCIKSIFGISIAGLLFSGYLSYSEIFASTCPFGGCSSLLGVPVCIYGFVMYLAISILSYIGIKAKK